MTPIVRVVNPQEFWYANSWTASPLEEETRRGEALAPDSTPLGGVLELDAEHLGEVLAQVVGRRALHPAARHRDVGLHGGREVPAWRQQTGI